MHEPLKLPGEGGPLDVLLVLARPADELLVAGTIVGWTLAGVKVGLAVLSNGRDDAPAAPEPAGDPTAELADAARVLGLRALRPYQAEGTPWTASDALPRPLSRLHQDEERLTSRLERDLRAFQPRCVVTYGPEGYDGHPDRVATHRLVVSALVCSQRSARTRVYYAAGLSRPLSGGSDWRPVTHRVDVSRYARLKLRAMGAYRSRAVWVSDTFLASDPARVFTEHYRDPLELGDGEHDLVLDLPRATRSTAV